MAARFKVVHVYDAQPRRRIALRSTIVRQLPAMLISLIIASGVHAQTAGRTDRLQIGERAPELAFANVLNGDATEPHVLSDLEGSVIVLEFFQTWCSGCIASFGRLNEIAAGFIDGSVHVIAVSNENRQHVQGVIDQYGLEALVALTETDRTFGPYVVNAFPKTVVIDASHNVVAITSPEQVTQSLLQQVLRGEAIDLPVQQFIVADLDWEKTASVDGDAPDAIAQVVLRRVSPRAGRSDEREPGRIVGDGLTIDAMYRLAYGVDEFHCENHLPENSEHYRVSVRAATRDAHRARRLLQSMLDSTFDINASWVERELDVMVLRRVKDMAHKLGPAGEGPSMIGRSSIQASRVDMAGLARGLALMHFHKSVYDETGLEGRFSIDLSWQAGVEGALEAALKSIGLELVAQRRVERILSLTPKQRR